MLFIVFSVLLVWPAVDIDSAAWGQAGASSPTEGSTAPEGGPAGSPPQTQGQPPFPPQPQQPFFLPQYPSQYPPAFQGPRPLTQPYGAPTPTGPDNPTGGFPIPPWTPPVPPPPSQTHLPGALPPGLQTLGGGKLFDLHVNPNVTETWTDNFFETAQNKQENYRTVLGLGTVLLYNGATTKGILSSNAGLTHDSIVASNGWTLFPTVTAALIQTLSPRLSLSLTDSYTRSDNPTQADQFGLNTQRQTFSSNSFTGAANYLMDQVATQAYYTNSHFSIGGANGSDTTSNILGASASTQIGVYNTVGVGYSFSWSDTSGSNSGRSTTNTAYATVSRQTGQYSSAGLSSTYSQQSAPDSANDSQILNVSLFTTYGLPSGLSLSGSLGYSVLIPSSGSTTSGVTSNSYLSYRFTRAVVSVGIFSDFRQTALEGQNFGIVKTQGVTGSFVYTFTPFLSGSLQSTYATNSTTGVGNNASTPDSSNFTSSALINWQLLRWLSMYMNYTYLLRSSPSGSLTGSGTIPINTATIGLSTTF